MLLLLFHGGDDGGCVWLHRLGSLADLQVLSAVWPGAVVVGLCGVIIALLLGTSFPFPWFGWKRIFGCVGRIDWQKDSWIGKGGGQWGAEYRGTSCYRSSNSQQDMKVVVSGEEFIEKRKKKKVVHRGRPGKYKSARGLYLELEQSTK